MRKERRRILLASHGTPGARAAEEAALELARQEGAALAHLYVVPEFWSGMRGDDWLNNAVTQETFGHYLEGELAKEAHQVRERLEQRAADLSLALETHLLVGDPTGSLLHFARHWKPDLVVLGTPRPAGIPGYRSRMKLERLARTLGATLMLVPHGPEAYSAAG